MRLIDELQTLLEKANVGEFFRTLKRKLLEKGAILLEPHEKEEKSMQTSFYCTVGLCADSLDVNKPDVDLASQQHFIKLATAEIVVYLKMGVESPSFNVYPSAFFSYTTYPLLKTNKLDFVKSNIQCDIDALFEIIDKLTLIREKVNRAIRLTQKKFNKLYIAKCNKEKKIARQENLIKFNDPECVRKDPFDCYNSGYEDAINDLLKWMYDIEEKI